jgi:hypothetical protein
MRALDGLSSLPAIDLLITEQAVAAQPPSSDAAVLEAWSVLGELGARWQSGDGGVADVAPLLRGLLRDRGS